MKKWDVFVYGDINVDVLVPNTDTLPPGGEEWDVPVMETMPGGGAALFAMGLAKLNLHPVFKGALGGDCYGHYLFDCMKSVGVDTELLEVNPEKKTGISISFTNERDRSFLTFRGTNADIDFGQIPMEQVKDARHIHVTGYCGSRKHDQYLTLLKKLKKETDVTISFDLGWDDSGEWNPAIRELFPYIDVLFMNETESIHYGRTKTAEEAAKEFAGYGPLTVIKLGKKGSLAVKDGQVYHKEGFTVSVVDTTGAGDSFNAGFLYGFLRGAAVEESLRFGNGCGALSCTGLGGNTAFPTEETLLQFVAQ